MHGLCQSDCKHARKELKLLMRDISVTRDAHQWFVDLPEPYNFFGWYNGCCKWDAICQCIQTYQRDNDDNKSSSE